MTAADTAPPGPVPTAPVRRPLPPLLWNLRRELWENPAIYWAPLAIGALVLAAFVYSAHHLPGEVLRAAADAKAATALNIPYAAAAGAVFVISAAVAVFYCLAALHGERRDRSILFWKSLPVSDTSVVLSKAAVPMIVQPLLVLAIALTLQLVMLAWSAVTLAVNGVDLGLLWTNLKLPLFWRILPYFLLVNALWQAPIYAWLMMVSAWARRMTFVWALAPWFGLSLFEYLAFRTNHVPKLVAYRLFGAFAGTYAAGPRGKPVHLPHGDVDRWAIFMNPDLWLGLAVAAAFLVVCVWLRRRHDPI